MGAGILVGNYQGAGDHEAARRAGWSSMYVGWIFTGASLLLLALFFRPAVLIFLSERTAFDPDESVLDACFNHQGDPDEFVSLCRVLVTILSSWCMFDVINVICGGALKGAGDTRFVMAVGVATGFFLWVPMILAAARYAPSVVNLWLTLPLYVFVLAMTLLARWCRGAWCKIKLIDERPQAVVGAGRHAPAID